MPKVRVTMHCDGAPSGFEVDDKLGEDAQGNAVTTSRTLIPEQPQEVDIDQSVIDSLKSGRGRDFSPRYSFDVEPVTTPAPAVGPA